ncbi:MAG: helix-turn-helix domain-containing protein [Micromonosporaceae bacterium]
MDLLRAYSKRSDLADDLAVVLAKLASAGSDHVPFAPSVRSVNAAASRSASPAARLGADGALGLAAAYDAGTTRSELAARYGISVSTVARLLREHRQNS